MVEISEIKDRETLKEWLETQPRPTSVAIAHRAAMRVLPLYWDWVIRDSKRDLTALPVLRQVLIAGVATVYPTPAIRSADAAAALSALSAVAAAANAAFSDFAAHAAMWHEFRSDCTTLGNNKTPGVWPLWTEQDNPLQSRWDSIKNTASKPDANGVDWSFWITWYDNALTGKPQNWPMLRDIALIGPDTWDKGPEVVNPLIAEIETEYEKKPEKPLSPKQTLAANANVIHQQLDTLKLFVENEIARLREPNDIPTDVMQRIVKLEAIVKSVNAMLSKFARHDFNGETALAVVNENLPKVIDSAEKLAQNHPEREVSETILMMGATIKHLTDCGTPGYMATGLAVVDVVGTAMRNWLNRAKH